jgi:starvation-inducible outer membrane lipoprotein
MRPLLLLPALVIPLAALAQTPPLAREAEGEPRKNQKIERLHSEDDGATIDELRVGGQTQSVTVKPKAAVPAYEIQPNDMARTRPAESRDGMAGRSQRVWNVLGF